MTTRRLFPVLALALAGCPAVPVPVNVPFPTEGVSGGSSSVPSGPRPGEDVHYLQADDYFIADRAVEGGWQYVHLAKQRVAPSPGTKAQGQYFKLSESRDVWTQHAWLTRPAIAADLSIGAVAFCHEGPQDDGAYGPPRSKDEARTGTWFVGRITDTSDGFKGVYRIDTYNCQLRSIRVAR